MPFLSYDLCFSLLLSQQKWKKKWGELNCSPPSKNHQALCPRPDIDLGTCLFFFFFFLFCFFCQLSFVLWNLQKNSTWRWSESAAIFLVAAPYMYYLNLFRLHCRLWWDKVLHSKVYITTAIIIIIKANLEDPLFEDLAKAAGQMRQRSAEATATTVLLSSRLWFLNFILVARSWNWQKENWSAKKYHHRYQHIWCQEKVSALVWKKMVYKSHTKEIFGIKTSLGIGKKISMIVLTFFFVSRKVSKLSYLPFDI